MFQSSTHPRRVRGASDQLDGDGTTTLAALQCGRAARIVEVCDDGDPATARRMCALGFTPDAPVVVVRRAPLADPVIFRVAGYEVALRRAQARRIRVRPNARPMP